MLDMSAGMSDIYRSHNDVFVRFASLAGLSDWHRHNDVWVCFLKNLEENFLFIGNFLCK